MKKDFIYKEFLRKEENILRAPYNPELEFYSVIKSGDVQKAEELCRDTFTDKKGLGVLSKNNMQNLKYHFVITIALIARYCIDGGMDVSTSYALSDFYIQKADESNSPEELNVLHRRAALDYAGRMKKLRKDKICSIHVVRCIDYIHDNLHSRITVEELAELVDLNPSYLSRLFKKETGVTLTDYVSRRRVEYAIFLLNSTDMQIQTIAQHCGMPDVNYFTRTFKKHTGKTPSQYRKSALTPAP